MKAEIISIGTELLLGKIVNTNAAYLSQKFAQLGINLYYHTVVGDNPQRLKDTLQTAMLRSDIIVTTGGLGPTVDDITLKLILEVSNKKAVLNKKILKTIETHFQKRQIKMPKNNIRQAYVPNGSKVLPNANGTAPGFIVHLKRNKILIALPGPPRELIPITEHYLYPYLKNNIAENWTIKSKVIRITGLAESEVNRRVKNLLILGQETTVGIYAKISDVSLHITSRTKNKTKADKEIKKIVDIIRKRIKDYIFTEDNETIEEVTAKLLLKKRKTIAVAESCTGGNVSNFLTNVSGSSKYLNGSLIAYSNKAKTSLLNIPKDIIKKHGAVSNIVAKKMAANIRTLFNSDIGIGITGIAGPTGGTKTKPVGLVYIALADKNKIICQKSHFTGNRKTIKTRITYAALDMIRRYLL